MRLALGDAEFDVTHRALVMGILNRTPDSFYDAGRYYDFDAFLAKAAAHVADGADFLDVGGVKAGPGRARSARTRSWSGSCRRSRRCVARFDLPISVDTWRASVLDAALAAGASVGNDISGFADPDYLPVAARSTARRWSPPTSGWRPGCPIRTRSTRRAWSRRSCASAPSGPRGRRRPASPASGSWSTPASTSARPSRMSLELLRASDRLAALGYPVFLSASNKRFLGEVLGLAVDERRLASVAAHAQGIALGCRVLRAHDVRGSRRVADVMAAILEARGCGRSARWLSCTSSTAPTRRWSARRRPSSSAVSWARPIGP